METRSKSKRIKLDPEVYNEVHINDILKLYPVRQNVFKYLDGWDIIRASEVNKEWYEFTGETQQMKKIVLVFGCFNDDLDEKTTEEHMQILRNSKRKYQNINIGDTRLELILPILKDRAGSWKFVEFYNSVFSKSQKEQWREVLRIIEPSVEEVSISSSFGSTETDVDLNWTFPCLKFLEMFSWDHNWDHSISKYFLRCTSLVKIQWTTHGDESTAMKRDIRTILRNNKGLEEFEIISWESPVDTQLDHPFEFKLKKFFIHGDCCSDTNIYSFLERQASNLEALEIYWRLSHVSLELILVKMPKLTSLAFDCRNAIIDWTQTFPVNKTISSLELNYSLRSNISFTNLIKVLPNLKHIKLDRINDEQLLSLAQEASALESLEVTDFKVSRLPEENLFPHLKKFEVSEFSCDLSESAADNNFAKLVKEEIFKYFERCPWF